MGGRAKKPRPLTLRQQEILGCVKRHWNAYGTAPSSADIAKETTLSRQAAYEHLKTLMEKGYLEHSDEAGLFWKPSSPSKPPEPVAEVKGNERETSGKYIPLIGVVAAGTPILAYEQIEGEVWCEHARKTEVVFALRVQEDTMIKIGIQQW